MVLELGSFGVLDENATHDLAISRTLSRNKHYTAQHKIAQESEFVMLFFGFRFQSIFCPSSLQTLETRALSFTTR